jgi:hypothetical protein
MREGVMNLAEKLAGLMDTIQGSAEEAIAVLKKSDASDIGLDLRLRQIDSLAKEVLKRIGLNPKTFGKL